MYPVREFLRQHKDIIHIKNLAGATGMNLATLRGRLKGNGGQFSLGEMKTLLDALKDGGLYQRTHITSDELRASTIIKISPLVKRSNLQTAVQTRIYRGKKLTDSEEQAICKTISQIHNELKKQLQPFSIIGE